MSKSQVNNGHIAEALLSLVVPIDSIKPDPRNVRRHPDPNMAAIKRSLETYGQRKPIVVNSTTGHIEAGNGLWAAAKALGWTEIAVVKVQDDETTAKAFGIMDNRSAELAEWDLGALKDLLQELDTGAFPIELTGFDEAALEELVNQCFVPGEGLTADDEVPDNPPTICQVGDLWQLGQHRLLCGDATNEEDVERLMGNEKASLMVTDPPYGVNYETSGENPRWRSDSRPIVNDNLGKDQGAFWHDALVFWPLQGDAYIFSPSGPPVMALALSIQSAGIEHHQWLIWVKQQFALGRSHYHYRHEHIFYGWKVKTSWNGSRTEDSVWECDRPFKSTEHPTMKPVALCERAIINSSKNLAIVVDPFGGSGSTLIACEKLGRHCFMLEIEPGYCDVIIKRWEDFTGKKAKKCLAQKAT